MAKPLNKQEKMAVQALCNKWHTPLEEAAPISFIGSGADLKAVDCAISRAAQVLAIPPAEIKNRLTIAGGLEIGRYPGTVPATFAAPVQALKKTGLYELAREQYQLLT